jgi:hypothetical protein
MHTNLFGVRACTHQPVWCAPVLYPNFFGVLMYVHQKLGVHEVNTWCAFRLPQIEKKRKKNMRKKAANFVTYLGYHSAQSS